MATSYGYDSVYQLLSATQGATATESYAYDAVGNRTSSLGVASYTTNSSNEMTANSNASFTYDNNGNTLTKVIGGNTTSYAWDFENRMSSVTLPGSGGSVSFKYDPFGRRIYKSSSSCTSIYAYDGDNLVEETNASGGAIARYSQNEENLDEPLAMLRSSTTSYFEQDGLGSVTTLSNAAGALAQTYTYDSFGNQTASSGSLTNPFRFTAREWDMETNLQFSRARYYDPSSGRFISEDPVGLGPFLDSVNLYAYVKNNTLNYIDPLGLYKLKPGVPKPWAPLDSLLTCIESKSGVPLTVTSTNEPPPMSPHGPDDPHRRAAGLAADVRYPTNPGDVQKVLCAASHCGAGYAQDEGAHPSKNANAPHIHIQLPAGRNNSKGDLPGYGDKRCQGGCSQ